jgi:uncharacterized protein YkwD
MGRRLSFYVVVMTVAGMACSGPARYASQPVAEVRAIEYRVHELVNAFRLRHGLPPLKYDEFIADEGRRHSLAMATKRAELSHEGFGERLARIGSRIKHRRAAENLAVNGGFDDPALQAVLSWEESPGHRANMAGEFSSTGVGVAKAADGAVYVTQLYVLAR